MDVTKEELVAQLDGKRPKDLRSQGKSSKVKTLMIEDLRKFTYYLESQLIDKSVRIQTLLADKHSQRTEIKSLKDKLERRDTKLEVVPLLIKEEVQQVKEVKSALLKKSYTREILKIQKLERLIARIKRRHEVEINKLKAVIAKLRKRHIAKNMAKYEQNKLIKVLYTRIRTIKKELTVYKRTTKVLDERIIKRDLRIKKFQNKLTYKPRPKRAKVVRIKQGLTEEEKVISKLLSSTEDKRGFNLYELNLKTITFLQNNSTTEDTFDFNRLNILLKMSVKEYILKSEIRQIEQYGRSVSKLLSMGYINFRIIKGKNKYFYLTEVGKKFIESYKNYISYGKSPLLENTKE